MADDDIDPEGEVVEIEDDADDTVIFTRAAIRRIEGVMVRLVSKTEDNLASAEPSFMTENLLDEAYVVLGKLREVL